MRRHDWTDLAVITVAIAVDLVAWNGDRQLRSGEMLWWPVVPLLVVAVHLSLRWRHRRPVLVFGVQLGFALCCFAVPQFQAFAGLLVALFGVASRFGLRWSLGCLSLSTIPFLAHSSYAAQRSWADAAQLMILWLGLCAAVWAVGRFAFLTAQRDRLLRDQRAHEAVETERRRLARELHDTISSGVTTMIISAAAARGRADPRATAKALEVIEGSGVRAMAELHRMLGLLDGSGPEPVLADLAELVDSARSAGRRITITERGTKITLGAEAETAAFRVVQESLTNALKYAGPAAPVSVDLRWQSVGLQLEISDESATGGPQPPLDVTPLSSGSGLSGLRSRVEAIGGTLVAGPVAEGFRVCAVLPPAAPIMVRPAA